jgi:hypothetical protein
LFDHARVNIGRRGRGWLALAIVAGSVIAATDAGAVAVVVPETAISAAQYSPVSGSLPAAPSFACNADGCLAAWRDGRQGLSYRIWARRLSADGTPRDPAAFLVSADTFDASDPEVATDGTRFVVAWSDGSQKMYLTRIDADDSLHSDSAAVADLNLSPVRPAALASNGDGYLLVYAYPVGTPGGRLKAFRADRDGHILDATPILISDHPAARGIADVIWTGTQYLVVWNQGQSDDGDAYAARVLADGTVVDASGFFVATLSGFSNRPRLALGGGKLLLVSGRSGGSSGGGIDAALLDTDGRNGQRVSLPTPPSALTASSAAAAWNGSAFVVTWIDGSGRTAAARITPNGSVPDTTPIFLTSGQTQTPVIAVSGTTSFIVLIDNSYQAPSVRLVSLSAAGVPGHANAPPLNVSSAPQRLLAAARGTGHTLVVWADDVQGSRASAVLAARVSDDGAVLDATPIVLSAAAPDKQRASAAAASAGGQYLVSWWEQNGPTTDQFQVVRVSAGGALLDTSPTVLAANLFFNQVTSIAASGGTFLVAWSARGILSTPAPINAVLIGPDGKPIGASFRIGRAEASYPWAVAAAEGGGYLAAWNLFSGGMSGVELEPIDAAGVQGSPVHLSPQHGSMSLDLVPSPGRTLVWLNRRAGMIVSPAPPFTKLSGMDPFDVGRYIGMPSWNGAVHVSAGVTSGGIYDFDSAGVDVSLLSSDGALIDPPTTIVPPHKLTTLPPAAIGLAPNKNLVVYSRLVPEHDHGALRVRFQIVDSSGASNPDGGQATDGGGTGDGGGVSDGGGTSGDGGGTSSDGAVVSDGPTGDAAGDAVDAIDAVAKVDAIAASDAADASVSDARDAAPDATIEARPDVPAATDATADTIGDAHGLDAGSPDTVAAGDSSTPRDAVADAGSGSSSGCSCAMSPAGGTPSDPEGALALLVCGLAVCLGRQRRHR